MDDFCPAFGLHFHGISPMAPSRLPRLQDTPSILTEPCLTALELMKCLEHMTGTA